MNRILKAFLIGIVLVIAVQGAYAEKKNSDETPVEKSKENEKNKKVVNSEKKATETTPAPETNTECKFCRWIDLQTATISTRYRWVQSNGVVTKSMLKAQPYLKVGEKIRVKQVQQQQIYEFNFKFDEAGRYKIHTRLSSGRYFTRSFSETGWGDQFNGEGSWMIYPRQFYFSAEPVKGLEFQYGGLDINHGENTENTTYDNDGYVTGERIKLKRPDKVWFDEVSVTYAFFGGLYKPSFFDRAQYLNKSNYHQFLVAKKFFGNRVATSLDYTSHATMSHLREGMVVKTPELKVVDSIRVEGYHRLEDYRGVKHSSGYNVQVEKNIKGKLFLQGGLANEDYRYNVLTIEDYNYLKPKYIQAAGTLTADRMIRGMSPYLNWKYQLSPEFSVFGFMTMDINKPTPLPFVYNGDHFSVGVQFDLKKVLQKKNLF